MLKDLAKLENTVLFEYVPLEDDAELAHAIELTNILADPPNGDASAAPAKPAWCRGKWDTAWSAVTRLRSYVPLYNQGDRRMLPYNVALLNYALRSLSFRELSARNKEPVKLSRSSLLRV